MFTYKKHWLIDGRSLGFGDDVMDMADCAPLPWTFEHKGDDGRIKLFITVEEIPNLTDLGEDKGQETAYMVFLRAIKQATDVTIKDEKLVPTGARRLTEDEYETLNEKMIESSKNRLCRDVTPVDYMYNTLLTYYPIDLTTTGVNSLDDLFEKAEIIFLRTLEGTGDAALVKKDDGWVCVNHTVDALKQSVSSYRVHGAFRHTFARYDMECHAWKRNRTSYMTKLCDGDFDLHGFLAIDGYPLDGHWSMYPDETYLRRIRWFYFDDPGVRDIWYPDEETEEVNLDMFFWGPNGDEEEETPEKEPQPETGDEEEDLPDYIPEAEPEEELPEQEPEPEPEQDDSIPLSTVAKIKIPKKN